MLYLHTYSGNKVEGSALLEYLPADMDLALFDFIGSGNSDEGYTTYGLKEKFDVANMLRALEAEFAYEEYFLWGRSMGAVVVIHFADHFLSKSSPGAPKFKYKRIYENRGGKIYKKIQRVAVKPDTPELSAQPQDQALFAKVRALVLDSPFTNLKVMLQGSFTRPPKSARERPLFPKRAQSAHAPRALATQNRVRRAQLRPSIAGSKAASAEHVCAGRLGRVGPFFAF